VTMAWRAPKPIWLWLGSIVYVPVREPTVAVVIALLLRKTNTGFS
jgi:hypothetical protein